MYHVSIALHRASTALKFCYYVKYSAVLQVKATKTYHELTRFIRVYIAK